MKVNLDLSSVRAFGARTVVPTGRYNVVVAAVEATESRAGDGMLVIDFEICSGEFDGATLIDRILIQHEKEKVAKIGLSKIKAILVNGGASNANGLADTDDMLGLKLSLSVTEDEDSFEDNGKVVETTKNNIQGYLAFKNDDESKAAEPKKQAPKKATPKKEAPKKEKSLPWAK